MELKGEAKLLRIFLGESDKVGHTPLHGGHRADEDVHALPRFEPPDIQDVQVVGCECRRARPG